MERFKLYQKHHEEKTLGQFFPPLYAEYFALWPIAPTADDIRGASGNIAVATAKLRNLEEHVRGFDIPE